MCSCCASPCLRSMPNHTSCRDTQQATHALMNQHLNPQNPSQVSHLHEPPSPPLWRSCVDGPGITRHLFKGHTTISHHLLHPRISTCNGLSL